MKFKKDDCKGAGLFALGAAGLSALSWGVAYLSSTNQFICLLLSNNSNSKDCYSDTAHSIGWHISQMSLDILPFITITLLIIGLVLLAVSIFVRK